MEAFLGIGFIGCVLFAIRCAWPAARSSIAGETPVVVPAAAARPKVVTVGEQIASVNTEFEAGCRAIDGMNCSAEEKEAHRFQLMIQRDRRLSRLTR